MSDNTIPFPGPPVAATAVISDQNGPISGAVWDSQPTWAVADPTVATLSPVDLMSILVTPVAAGVTALTVSGVYQGFSLTASAQVTVTLVNGGFSVDIAWLGTPPAKAA